MKKSNALLLFAAMTSLIFAAGCATSAIVKDVELKPIYAILPNEKSKPIQLKKVVAKIERGTHVGAMQRGLLCAPRANMTWQGGRVNISTEELTDIFREELEKGNYQVVGNPNALFDDPSEWKAELLVGGLITDLKMNVCYPLGGYGNYSSAKGEAYVKINWQVYSRLDRKVIYEVSTEGSFRSPGISDDEGASIWKNAFAISARNLLADKGFHDLVSSSTKITSNPTFDKITIDTAKPFTTALQKHINDVRLSVATIFAGNSHGSGFFISSNGLLLTNQHVVGGAKFVKVKLITGREILGEVIRSDNRRDVALIKVEENQMTPLPIRETDINIGEDVYAIGSPLDERFQNTISKGIVSNYRVIDEMRFIQSDVNILPGNSGGPLIDNRGNLTGITEMHVASGGPNSLGLNFFIPINEALTALGIELKR